MSRLLLLSSSRTPNEDGFLEYARDDIAAHLEGASRVLFIPFAGVTVSWDDYVGWVSEFLGSLDKQVVSAHAVSSPVQALTEADAVLVGGGNSFRLLESLQSGGWIEPIRSVVKAGVPYMGWSAGSNMACPGLFTSNDMPIVEPHSFEALRLVPFQINPHYTEAVPPGHRGETRDQRLAEFIVMNPERAVVGLREGSHLKVDGDRVELVGEPARLFRSGQETITLEPGPVSI